ncbi:hypothetical protein DL770_000244 [Monosporascus sp. CRB-9-2]|nr:hypothetical protein DL770_000244 [Monosporascus sp. CRB-9-2]
MDSVRGTPERTPANELNRLIVHLWHGRVSPTVEMSSTLILNYLDSMGAPHHALALMSNLFLAVAAESSFKNEEPLESIIGRNLKVVQVLQATLSLTPRPDDLRRTFQSGLNETYRMLDDEEWRIDKPENHIFYGSYQQGAQVPICFLQKYLDLFASQLFAAGVVQDDIYFVTAMRVTLETQNLDSDLRGHLAAAAEWIFSSGDALRDSIESRKTTHDDYECGPLYNILYNKGRDEGFLPMDKGRWNWWRDRFQELTKGMQGTRPYDAARMMKEFEGIADLVGD